MVPDVSEVAHMFFVLIGLACLLHELLTSLRALSCAMAAACVLYR